MGFGFNLFFALFLLPLTVILLVIWALTRRVFFGKALGIIWLFIFALILFSVVTRPLSEKKVLIQEDYYGEYVIDRSYFAGKLLKIKATRSPTGSKRLHFQNLRNLSPGVTAGFAFAALPRRIC